MRGDLTEEQFQKAIAELESREKEKIFRRTMAQAKYKDVEYTISVHVEDQEKVQNMSKFFMTRTKELQKQEQEKKNKELKKKNLSEIVNRLSKPPEKQGLQQSQQLLPQKPLS